MDWSRIVAVAVAAVLFPVVFLGLASIARQQKPYKESGDLVFPTSLGIRVLGILVLLMGTAFLLAGGLGAVEDWDATMNAISTGFVLLGLLIYFMIGTVRLTPMGVKKQVLWFRSSLLWEEILRLEQEPGDVGDWVLTTASEKKLKFSVWYAGINRLVNEIRRHSPALRDERLELLD